MSKTVAVVGASSDRRKFGNKALRAFVAEGYTVYAINRNEEAVEGLPTFSSVLDVPGPIEMATVYVSRRSLRACSPNSRRNGSPRSHYSWRRERLADGESLAAEVNVIYACSIIGIGQNPSQFSGRRDNHQIASQRSVRHRV